MSIPSPNPDKRQALALFQARRLPEAQTAFEVWCREHPDDGEAWAVLGAVHCALSRWESAEACCRKAIAADPGRGEAHTTLGQALAARKQLTEAVDCYRRAIAIRQDDAEAHCKLAAALFGQGRSIEDALRHCREALRLDPRLAEAHTNLGRILHALGQTQEGIEALWRAVRLAPDNAVLWRTLIFYLNYHAEYDQATIYDAHLRWGELQADPTVKPPHTNKYGNPPDPQRRLKVGYVSPDFRTHPVAHFIEPILAHHDRAAVETFCYAELAYVHIARSGADPISARLKSRADHWIETFGMSDRDLAERIRADGIDILVDLAAHTANNRLTVFTHRPAPIQITYLGYPNTTGLSSIDYRLTDAWADPQGQEAFHAERLVRLPQGFLCYTPPDYAPEVAPPPVQANGVITFGSFNALQKTTPEVIAVWARLLHALPGARLVLKNRSWASGEQDRVSQEHYYRLFEHHGIERARVELISWLPSLADHLGVYGQIDIALDTFPYNGTTTTCEALWMGVPVVTLAGDRHAGRVGVSLLSRVGLAELIAETPEDYITLAMQLAGDTERLGRLRAGLRERMRDSPVCDGKTFTRALEDSYRTLWVKWREETGGRG